MRTALKAIVSVFFLGTLFSCRFQGEEDMVLVRGGIYSVGDGEEHAQYTVRIEDFYIQDHEVSCREFAEVYNWGLDNGHIYIETEELLNTRSEDPENLGEKLPDFYFSDMDYGVKARKDFPWLLIELHKKECPIAYNQDRFAPKVGMADYPVVCVSWYGAVVYCNLLSMREGFEKYYDPLYFEAVEEARGYRLPRTHEWEYAAVGGRRSEKHPYSGGDDPGTVAWYLANSSGHSHPVKTRSSNELGLYDMSGNVWEFLEEREGVFPGFVRDGGLSTGFRAWRGGGYTSEDIDVYRFIQHIDLPSYLQGFDDVGFRVILRP